MQVPGDAGLLTLKGLQQIQQADVVVYDRLVSDDIMNLVRRDADRVFVLQTRGYHCVPQEEINQILLREAKRQTRGAVERWRSVYFWPWWRRAGKTANAGIPVLGGSGYYRSFWLLCLFGFYLMHRDYAQSVRLITGHLKTGGELDWENLAAEKQTLVFDTGFNQAARDPEKLIRTRNARRNAGSVKTVRQSRSA